MSKGADTRQRVLEAAGRLFMVQGYHGTGLNQIVEEAKAPKGSLYFHFPGGKEEIASAALRSSAESWRAMIELVLGAAPSAASAVRTVCDALAVRLEETRFVEGCPVATVALEAAPVSDVLQAACASTYAGWLELIMTSLARFGASPDLARRLSTTILAAIEGGIVLAKAQRTGAPLREVGEELAACVELRLPAAAGGQIDGGGLG